MTAPRQILPGASYLVTRRCTQRQLLLRPSRLTNQIFLYLLAVASERYRVQVHAFCVLSNHAHLVVTDLHANLPRFLQFLDALVARAVNASLGRWEHFWASDTYSAVSLIAPADVVAKAAYVLANPVAAGLVSTGSAWPGLWSAPERIGGAAYAVERPKHFFAQEGTLPGRATLQLTVPRGLGSAEQFREQLATALEALENAARAEHGPRGGFLGVGRVLRQKPFARPRPGEPRRGLSPRVAGRDKWKRIEALQALAGFRRAYRAALAAWRARTAGVVFPRGTYLMRVLHDVPCEAFG